MHRATKILNRVAYTVFGIAFTKSTFAAWYIDPNFLKPFIFIGIPAMMIAVLTEAKEDTIFALPRTEDNSG